ncbi:MAG: hypothetical protein QXV23_02130 [Candidatus Bathyarchaeia archaeon]
MIFRRIVTKANTANIVAAIILIGAVIFGIVNNDAEILRNLSLFAAGYLFGRVIVKKGK